MLRELTQFITIFHLTEDVWIPLQKSQNKHVNIWDDEQKSKCLRKTYQYYITIPNN